MILKTRLSKIEKKLKSDDNKPIIIIGWLGADLSSPLTPEEMERVRATGCNIIWRGDISESDVEEIIS